MLEVPLLAAKTDNDPRSPRSSNSFSSYHQLYLHTRGFARHLGIAR